MSTGVVTHKLRMGQEVRPPDVIVTGRTTAERQTTMNEPREVVSRLSIVEVHDRICWLSKTLLLGQQSESNAAIGNAHL